MFFCHDLLVRERSGEGDFLPLQSKRSTSSDFSMTLDTDSYKAELISVA